MADYLVQYGRSAFVGRFASEMSLARGDRALVHSPRGREPGTVLCLPDDASTQRDGRIVSRWTAEEESVLARATGAAQRIYEAAAAALARDQLPAQVLDGEALLDDATILHVLAWAPVDLTPLVQELTAAFAQRVLVQDLGTTAVAADPTTCGKPDCGSGGCATGGGCGSGDCSRGAVHSPEDLTAYFRELRNAMDDAARTGRRELL